MKENSSNDTVFAKRLFWVGLFFSWICLFAILNTLILSGSGVGLTQHPVWILLGRVHPVVVHLPIGIFLFAGFLELFTVRNNSTTYRSAIQLCLLVGLIGGALSAISGLMLSYGGGHDNALLFKHQWVGLLVLVLNAIAWLFHSRFINAPAKKTLLVFRMVLFTAVISLFFATHYGASLTHGTNYLLDTVERPKAAVKKQLPLASKSFIGTPVLKQDDTLTLEQKVDLHLQVRTILAHNCYKCHGSEKVKGDLRLDHIDLMLKGGESGPAIVPGNANASELFKRISLPADHDDVMPSEGKKLSAAEIRVIGYWINSGALWPDSQQMKKVFRVADLAPRNPSLPKRSSQFDNPIDQWTDIYFKGKNLRWPRQADDRTFMRRVYMDIIGLLPQPTEIEAFLSNQSPNKRAELVRQLLGRQDDFASHWLSFWNDALRNDYTGTGYITGGRFNITDWLYTSIKTNKPFPQFVKELVSPTKESKGFIEGIKWRGEINASQRTEMQAAQNVAQVFLGLNLKCASCHNSFISDWKLTDAYGFANIFADSSLEINRCDKPTGKFTRPQMLWKDLGKIDSLESRKVKMAQLAEIMVKPENGRLYRTVVNRIWRQMLGRGLVEPVDQMDNQPWSQDLLDWMAFDFQQNGGDIKALIYRIATSKTYQTASVGLKDPNDIVLQNYTFRGVLRKRITAEQFADVAGVIIDPIFPDSIMKYKPKFDMGFVPAGGFYARAAFIANNSFLIAMGRPNRENVTTSRETQANLLQALELTNGDRFNAMLKRGAAKWKQRYSDRESLLQAVYALALGRKPNAKERSVAQNLMDNNPSMESIQDFFWALLLLPELQIID